MSSTVKTLVALSLLLNLLLIGFILGHVSRTVWEEKLHTNITDAAQELPSDKRDHFKAVMHRAEKETAPIFAKLDAARARGINALKTEPFDKKTFLAAMKDMEQLHTQLKQRVANAIIEAGDDLTPQERLLMADMLRRPKLPDQSPATKADQ